MDLLLCRLGETEPDLGKPRPSHSQSQNPISSVLRGMLASVSVRVQICISGSEACLLHGAEIGYPGTDLRDKESTTVCIFIPGPVNHTSVERVRKYKCTKTIFKK